MSFLDLTLDIVARRLTWLGITARPMTLDAASDRVPILDRESRLGAAVGAPAKTPAARAPVSLPQSRSRHLWLEAAPTTLLCSLYAVQAPGVKERAAEVAQLVRTLNRLVPPELSSYTWTHSAIEQGYDFLCVVYGIEVPSEERLRELAQAIAATETVDALAQAYRALPAAG